VEGVLGAVRGEQSASRRADFDRRNRLAVPRLQGKMDLAGDWIADRMDVRHEHLGAAAVHQSGILLARVGIQRRFVRPGALGGGHPRGTGRVATDRGGEDIIEDVEK